MQVRDLLKRYKLRNTQIRRFVIEIFRSQNRAFTHSSIEQNLGKKFNRVTLYRTLKTFEEVGLIHRIANENDRVEYALCRHNCDAPSHEHFDNHIHFKCDRCARTFCLNHIPVPSIKVPANYKVKDSQILLKGTCEYCNNI